MLEYNVKVDGVEDIDRLSKAVTGLESVLGAAKGSGKGLEEVRKIIVGLKGQGSVFQELANSIKSLDPAVARLEKTFQGVGSTLAHTIKSELEMTRAVFRTELAGIAAGTGATVARTVSKEVGDGLVSGTKEAVAKAKSVAAKARVEMTKAYEELVNGDGFKVLTNDGVNQVRHLKQSGATISPWHAQLIKQYDNGIKQLRLADAEWEKLVGKASARDYSMLFKDFDGRISSASGKSAKESAAVFQSTFAAEMARGRDTFANFTKRLTEGTGKSAKESAEVFKGAFAAEMARGRDTFANFTKRLTEGTGKSAKESAEVFKGAFAAELARGKETFANFTKQLTEGSGKSAKESAAVFSQEFARGVKVLADFEKAMGLSKTDVAKSAKESADVFNRVFSQQTSKSSMPVQKMSRLDAGDAVYASSMAQMREYYKTIESGNKELPKTSKGFQEAAKNVDHFGTKVGDSHAAVRGLASGFNLLWLTWGNLGPLMAGAALSNTFMKSAKEGMQVADTMNTIKVLGEASAEEVAKLNNELLRIGSSSIFGPIETANAMKTLTLAGLKANEVLAQTRNVMDFAMAGDTNIQNAADVLVSVTTAFGTGAAGFSRSADIIVRAAADSKASVESFGEAMKTASVVGEQYGAKQEDVATMISLLANLGIQGTAAGTAIRNMYADLSGRTEKTSKIMKRFGLDFRDAKGNMLPLVETVEQMSHAMAQMNGKDAKSFLQALLSERGGKAMVAAMAAYNQQIEVNGVLTNKLEAQVTRLQNTYGTTSLAAAEMGESTLKAWQRAGAAMQTSLDKAFSAMEPQLYSMAASMQNLFNDPTFIAGLQTIAGGIASLGKALSSNAGLLTGMLAAWGGWKLATVALSALLPKNTFEVLRLNAAHAVASAGLSRLTGVTTAHTAAALAKAQADRTAASAQLQANLATGAGVSVFGRMAGILPGIGIALAGATVLWDLYTAAKNRANSATQLGIERSKNVIKNMEERNEGLAAEIEALKKGTDAQAALNDVQSRQNFDNAYADKKSELDSLADAARKAEKTLASMAANESKFKGQEGYETAAKGIRERANADIAAYNSVKASLTELEDQYTKTAEATRTLTKERDALQEAAYQKQKDEQEASMKAMLAKMGLRPGDLNFDAADPYGDGGRFRGPSAARSYLDEEHEKFKQIAEAEKTIVQALYDQGKVSATEYYDWVKFKQEAAYQAERAALSAEIAAMAAANPQDAGAQKAMKEAAIKLQVLDLKYSGEKLRLEAEATKAIEERLSPMQQLVIAAKDYVSTLQMSETEIVGLTRGGSAAKLAAEEIKVQEEFAKRRLDAEKRYQKEKVGKSGEGLKAAEEEYRYQLETLRYYELQSLEVVRQNEALKANERLKGVNGMRQAFDDYAERTKDVAGSVRSATTNILTNLEDRIAEAMVSGKGSVRDFVTYTLTEMAKLTSSKAVGGLMGMLGGAATSWIGGMWGNTSTTSSMYSLTNPSTSGLGLKFNAKGGVYDSPNLSSYSNQVHSTPKLFAFAQGGVFGEAGPEAIMPLTRGADGNLGVRAFGGGGGGSGANINITTHVTVTASGEVQTQAQSTGNGSIGEVLGRELNTVIKDGIAREFRPGGIAWRHLNGYN